MKKLPIGIQSFESLRNDDYVYVDKTRFVYDLTHSGGSYFFLSRPRRFGKSLLLTTLKAYFEGKRHLFEGLAIMDLPTVVGARQIEERDYALPFANDPRQLYRVAVNFNTEKRNIDEWEIRDENKQESK